MDKPCVYMGVMDLVLNGSASWYQMDPLMKVILLSSAEAHVMNSSNYHFEALAYARCHTQLGHHQGVCRF